MLLRPHRSLRCATESCFSIRGNRENEFASFQGLRHGNLAISSQQSRQKTTLAQWVRNSSRATRYTQRLAAAVGIRGAALQYPEGLELPAVIRSRSDAARPKLPRPTP